MTLALTQTKHKPYKEKDPYKITNRSRRKYFGKQLIYNGNHKKHIDQ